MDTSKIMVEIAKPREPRGSEEPTKAWGKAAQNLEKHSLKQNNGDTVLTNAKGKSSEENPSNKKKELKARDQNKEEFLEVMKSRSRSAFWGNDDTLKASEASEANNISKEKNDDGDSDDSSSHSDDEDSEEQEETGSREESESEARHESSSKSHLNWLRSKVRPNDRENSEGSMADEEGKAGSSSDGDTGSESSEDEDNIEKPKTKIISEEAVEDGANNIAPPPNQVVGEDDGIYETKVEEGSTGRLFVRNLAYTCSEEDLREAFEPFGTLAEVHIPVDDSKIGKGFGFVQYVLGESASKALEELDGQAFQGRLLHVMPARGPPVGKGGENSGGPGSSSFKDQKERERREKATETTGWNASFLRSDAVVDALAERMNVKKGDILDREERSGDIAVRLALAETAIIQENREYFEAEGVDLSALEAAPPKPGKSRSKGESHERSNTVILVKNLPYTSDSDELMRLFGAHGDVARVLLPPSKAVALVEFLSPADARAAFKRLAYRRYQHVPLYLEWAPLRVFKAGHSGTSDAGTKRAEGATITRQDDKAAGAADGVEATADISGIAKDTEEVVVRHIGEPCSLYVKNLSFATTEDKLKKAFQDRIRGEGGAGIRAVKIPRKQAAKGKATPANGLSMGYGFVEFDSEDLAKRALETMGGIVLDGHKLELKQSTKRISGGGKSKATTSSGAKANTLSTGMGTSSANNRKTKLVVRNVPFQASARELRELFKSFGQLKRVKMPKKFDGSHRGFAFVDFVSPNEAAAAYSALSSSHLYGRHLVLEWAEDDATTGLQGGDEPSGSQGGTTTSKSAREASLSLLREKAARDLAGSSGGPISKKARSS
jgi:multiple RNA-binding domain-containing protein 1